MKMTIQNAYNWIDYELLDTGNGLKLERFGPYGFIRPEVQAMWSPTLSQSDWQRADAVFQPTGEESGGHWDFQKKVPVKWQMAYPLLGSEEEIRFWAQTTPGRHLGLFPECAAHWDWAAEVIQNAGRPVKILNLFGYTGLATLSAAAAGAHVTHVDASKKAVTWARENQILSGLDEKPVRWLVEDALKFVLREGRRGNTYDGILIDPPKFGRGPKGEVWEVYKSLPALMAACRKILSQQPLFFVVTVYAVKASALHIYQVLDETLQGFEGSLDCGELVTVEKSAGRLLSQAVYARWQAG
ncbi:MAG: class I SAM-dependent methyltransferase [Anaerolineales bacterium]|nr:class I SAM-dependent methyltransferase [Anaerolineales bacterium]